MDRNTLSHYGWIVIVIIILSCMIIMSTPLGKFWARGFEATWAGFGQTNNNAMDVIKPNPNPNPDTPDPTPDEPILEYDEEGAITYGILEYYGIDTTDGNITVSAVETDSRSGKRYKIVSVLAASFNSMNCPIEIKSITLPDTLKTIEATAFSGQKSLQTVNVGNGLETIGRGAFAGCISIETINLPDTVKTIEATAFDTCVSLREITIPSGVEAIKEGSFAFCENLMTITLPNTLKTIEPYSFKNCHSLREIHFNGTMEEWNNITKYETSFYISTSYVQDLTTPGSYDGAQIGYTVICNDGNIEY